MEKLMTKGANPNVKDEKGRTPLHHVLWELSQSRSNVELKAYGECFEVLLKDASLPGIVNSQDNEGNTALHLAVQLGERQKVNSQDNEGNTALHLAIRYGIILITSFSYKKKRILA